METEQTQILFLREFVKRAALSLNPPQLKEYLSNEIEMPQQKKPAPFFHAKEEDEKAPEPERVELKVEQTSEQKVETKTIIPKMIELAKPAKAQAIQSAKPIVRTLAISAPTTLTRQQSSEQGILGMEKLNSFLRDPSIQTVECPGAGKPIRITRSGLLQTTNIALTEDEIKVIMKDLSEKTRIPLMSGLFKVAYQNLIITAIVSEFVGTRFIVQKGSPQLSATSVAKPSYPVRMPQQVPPAQPKKSLFQLNSIIKIKK